MPEEEDDSMYRPARIALRIFLIIAVTGLVPLLFNSSTPGHGPYASALSSLPVSQTFAATKCSFQGCTGGSRFNTVCGKATSATNCQNVKGFCIFSNC